MPYQEQNNPDHVNEELGHQRLDPVSSTEPQESKSAVSVPLASLLIDIPGVKKAQVHPERAYEYVHTLKGRRNAWYKPLLALLLMVIFYITVATLLAIPYVFYILSTGTVTPEQITPEFITNLSQWSNFVYIMGSIIIFIPCTFLVNFIVYGQRPGTLSSVAGRLRKNLLFGYLVLAAAVVGVFNVGIPLLAGNSFPITLTSEALLMVVLIIIMVPFQAAAEEYVFRGWITQVVGSCSRSPIYGMLMAAVISIPFFTALHGATDPMVVTYLASFATISLYLVYKTGGLEASIGLHIMNNICSLLVSVLSGAADTALANTSTLTLPQLVVGDMMLVVYTIVALIFFKYHRDKGTVSAYAEPQMAQVEINDRALRTVQITDQNAQACL